MEYLIIDGYNIINAWPDLKKDAQEHLENARWKLAEVISNYQGYKKIKVVIVYDAHLVKGSVEKHEVHSGVEVVFTKENETADNYIERMAHLIAREHNVRVATSDFLEQTIILSKGATRISANELWREVKSIEKNIREVYLQKTIKNNTIGSQIGEDILKVLEDMRRQK